MSDKNPYYSIPKALGEPREEIDMLPTPEVTAALAKLSEDMERQIWEALSPMAWKSPRPTAIRVHAGGFEVVEVDDKGDVIEPLRCTCGGMVVMHGPKCPFYCLTT